MDSADAILGHSCPNEANSFIACWRNQRHTLRNELARLLTTLYMPDTDSSLHRHFMSFSSDLLDYACAGHFVIYHELVSGQASANPDCRTLQGKILLYIHNTTDQILRFNEQLECLEVTGEFRIAPDQLLAKLARVLLMRFALEEQLMELGTQAGSCGQSLESGDQP
jgi:regulator of sigma D